MFARTIATMSQVPSAMRRSAMAGLTIRARAATGRDVTALMPAARSAWSACGAGVGGQWSTRANFSMLLPLATT